MMIAEHHSYKIVMNKKMPTKEIAIVKKINPVIEKINSFSIVSAETMKEGVQYLSQLNQFLDKLTEEKEKLTKPLNEALKEVRSRYKPTELLLEGAISHLRSDMSLYQTEQLKIQKIEEEKIANRIGEGKGKLKVETAIEKINNLDTPASHVSTDAGAVKFRTDKKLKITDETLIPREYLIIDEKKLFSSLKLGNTIPGAEIEEVQTPINSR